MALQFRIIYRTQLLNRIDFHLFHHTPLSCHNTNLSRQVENRIAEIGNKFPAEHKTGYSLLPVGGLHNIFKIARLNQTQPPAAFTIRQKFIPTAISRGDALPDT